MARLDGHEKKVSSVRFNPNSTRVASASDDGTVRLWDSESGAELLVLEGHQGPVTSVAFSSDGQDLISASVDGTVRIWSRTEQDIFEGRP
jgi:WD40 repeat protein